MLRVSVLGSCVTGDAAYAVQTGLQLVSYHARTSFISLNSPPLTLAEESLEWSSAFDKRSVVADFRKTVLPSLAEHQPDAIVFDLMDERLDLLRCGESYVLLSGPLIEAGFPGKIPLVFERIERLSAQTTQLWRQACTAVAARIQALFPSTCLILHRCWFADEYVDGDTVHRFDPGQLRENSAMNEMLAEYYAHFAREFPGLKTVEVETSRRGYAQHRFGLAPYHYEPAYAGELMGQILRTAEGGGARYTCSDSPL